ncbi:MAG: NUDIX hydrolase [Spirochaetales bacterium]|nr:NUDIX hydrolase [Spirochaetales bacterium]
MRFPYHGAGIALVLDNKILMGKRSDTPFHGTWCVPGGCREKGIDKDDFATAVRETFEETGIVFSDLDATYLGKWTLKAPFFSWSTFFYRITSFDQKLVPFEFYELQWLKIDDILNKTDKKKHFRPFTKSEVQYLLSII